MKNYFIATLLCLCMSGTIAKAQQKKTTTTTKKPTTTVKSTPPKTTTTKTTTTTTTSSSPTTVTPTVEEKKATTTTNSQLQGTSNSSTTTTTTTQSSGPSKSKPKVEEKVKEPVAEKVKEPKYKKVKSPRESASGDKGGVRIGIRAEASQLFILEQGSEVAISPGFNAGLIVNLPLSEALAIQPEVLYSMGVAQSKEVAGTYYKSTLNTVLAPVTLNINLGHGPTKFMINLGGYAQYLLSTKIEESIAGVKTSMNADLTGTDRFDYGATVGLGVKINSSFLIEARSFYGLKDNSGKVMFATFGIGYLF